MNLIAALLATGAATLIWQVASARAIMASLRGSELTLGLVLASWLLLTGGGAALAARLMGQRSGGQQKAGLSALLLLCPAALLGSLLLLRWAEAWLDPAAGPAVALGVAAVCLAPPCLLLGGAFGLLSLRAPADAEPAHWAGRIYLWESLGTVAAGILFHWVLAPLPLAATGLVAGAAPWGVGLVGLIIKAGAMGPRARMALVCCALAGVAAMGLMIPGVEILPLRPGANIPGYEVLERRNSRHGALAVLRRGEQRIFLSNGHPLFSSQDRPQVQGNLHLTLLAHPRPRRVLLVGGGLGGGLGEVLRHPVTRVDYVELDPQLINLARELGSPAQRAALADPRVHLSMADGRRLVAGAKDTYDLIMVALPGPTSALVNRFYTEQFVLAARQALRPGGLFCLSLAGSETYMGQGLALLHATELALLERAYPSGVIPLPGQRTLLLAGRDAPPPLSWELLARRLSARQLTDDHLGRAELVSRLIPFKREQYRQRLAELSPLSNTDLLPAAYFQSTLHWLAATSPALADALGDLGQLLAGRGWFVAAAALPLAWLLALGLRRRAPAGPALALAGLTGMCLQLSLLLLCQEQRGVIYHEVGALVTAFMAGLAAGARGGAALFGRWPRQALRLSLAGLTVAALLAAGLMTASAGGEPLQLAAFLAITGVVGLAVGVCYAPAVSSLASSTGRAGGVAASYAYAWDLAGAAGGALLASVLLLPMLGLVHTCLLCAALCAGYGLGLRR